MGRALSGCQENSDSAGGISSKFSFFVVESLCNLCRSRECMRAHTHRHATPYVAQHLDQQLCEECHKYIERFKTVVFA